MARRRAWVSLAALLVGGTIGLAAREGPPVVITLDRTVCFGTCPSYSLRITGDGLVAYEGRRFVRVLGKATTTISADAVRRLVAEFERIRYFELQDKYTAMVTDNPTTTTSIRVGSRFKRVIDYVAGPPALQALERQIDDTAGSARWVSVDAATVRELRRRGWTGARSEGVGYLLDAVIRHDQDTVKALIDAGVNPTSAFSAAVVHGGNASMIKLLIAAGANVEATSGSGFTPLHDAVMYSDPEVVEALIESKANVHAVGPRQDTVLIAAVRSCSAAKVRLVLEAGGRVDARNASGETALNVARSLAVSGRGAASPQLFGPARPREYDEIIALLRTAGAK